LQTHISDKHSGCEQVIEVKDVGSGLNFKRPGLLRVLGLGVALGRMFDQEVLVTYDGFETALDKYWSGAQVRMTHAFRGVFGTPALPVGSCCITNDDAGSESESDVEF
jgi:hypothetical protein